MTSEIYYSDDESLDLELPVQMTDSGATLKCPADCPVTGMSDQTLITHQEFGNNVVLQQIQAVQSSSNIRSDVKNETNIIAEEINNLINVQENGTVNFYQHKEEREISLSDAEAQEYAQEFLAATKKMLDDSAAERIHHFKQLENLVQQVHPLLVETDFFSGDTAGAEHLKADPTYLTASTRKIKGDKILMKSIHDDCKYAALVADPGAGKTTISKRYSKAVSSKDKDNSSLQGVDLVHFVTLAKLDSHRKGTFMELFFFNQLRVKMSEEAKRYGSLWVKENGDKILLVLDGLDQVKWTIKKCAKLPFERKAPVDEILYNVLHENMIPGIRILLTSRDFAIRNLNRDTRPDKIIAMTGLTEKNIKILIKDFAPKKCEAIIEHVFKKSPALRSLCSNPMFLIFTTAILAKDSDDAPESLSGVLMRLLYYFISSENQRVDNIRRILSNLCALALEGMEKQTVAFDEVDMERHGLDARQAQDLVIITPEEGTDYHYKLMEGSFRLFFCHQSVQEALAAVEISKKPDEEFSDFVWDQLHKDHWEVVLRILVGIIFNRQTLKDARKLTDGPIGGEEKRKILQEWLVKVISQNQDSCGKKEAKRMKLPGQVPNFRTEDLCSLLYECGDSIHDIIFQNMRSIIIKKRIRIDQMHAVSWVISHCRHGIIVEIESGSAACSQDLLVKGLRQCEKAKVKLSSLDLCITNQTALEQGIYTNSVEKVTLNVKQTEQEPFKLLAEIMDRAVTQKVEIFPEKMKENALLTKEQLGELKKITNGEVRRLNICRRDLASMSNTSSDIFRSVGELAKQLNVKQLFFKNLILNENELLELENGAGGHKVEISSGKTEDLP